MISRRTFAGRTLSLGALTFLTGCDISNDDAVQAALARVSAWNDRVQGWLFDGTKLAPTFAERDAVKDFRFNAYYQADRAPVLDESSYRLSLAGKIGDKKPWTVADLHALPRQSQITRHVCVEGWSMIGKWSGTPMRTFLERIGADLTAKYVGFECADGYYEGLDMASALHPQTLMTFEIGDNILAPRYGYPLKIRVPTKLGFKNPKHVTTLYVTNQRPRGFWTDRGYNWFSGI